MAVPVAPLHNTTAAGLALAHSLKGGAFSSSLGPVLQRLSTAAPVQEHSQVQWSGEAKQCHLSPRFQVSVAAFVALLPVDG
jgi:hypothetical protein